MITSNITTIGDNNHGIDGTMFLFIDRLTIVTVDTAEETTLFMATLIAVDISSLPLYIINPVLCTFPTN